MLVLALNMNQLRAFPIANYCPWLVMRITIVGAVDGGALSPAAYCVSG